MKSCQNPPKSGPGAAPDHPGDAPEGPGPVLKLLDLFRPVSSCVGAENFRRTSGELQEEKLFLGFFAIRGPQRAFLPQNLDSAQKTWYIDFSWGLWLS